MSPRRSSTPNLLERKEKEKRKRKEPSTDDHPNQVRGSTRPFSLKFHNYAPLNTPQSQKLMEVKDQLPPPRWMMTLSGQKNPNKYCRYHRDHDHDTDECLQLKDEIELLIR